MRQMRPDAVSSTGDSQTGKPFTAGSSTQIPSRQGAQLQTNAAVGSGQSGTSFSQQSTTEESGDQGKSFAGGFSFTQVSWNPQSFLHLLPGFS